jgi:ABC-type Zn uptake system ZnuABC Zn-binding protein ZnuA
MGYFAQRYGFKIVGAVVPSLSTEAESSAPDLVELKKLIALDRVTVVFTELGENPKVAEVLAREAHVASVPLVTHSLPKGEDYFGFVRSLADAIVGALANNRNPPRPLS